MFQLHARLAADTVVVGHFPLSTLLLSKDANYPWYILVPRREDINEIYHLAQDDRMQLLHESCVLAESIVDLHSPDKINIATIGNMVPQLHMHHVARYKDDTAWPGPVWGAAPASAYADQALAERVAHMREILTGAEFVISGDCP